MSEVEISEKGHQERFAQWEKIGLDRIKHDLLDGRYRVVGGPLQEQELAWEWVRMKEAEQKEAALTMTVDETARALGLVPTSTAAETLKALE